MIRWLLSILTLVFALKPDPALAYIGGHPGAEIFPASLAIFARERCSGVKIAKRKVLTAAHCVWPTGNAPTPTTDPQVTIAYGTFANDYVVAKISTHPSWRPDRFLDAKTGRWNSNLSEAAVDLAIVEVTTDISGIANAVISARSARVGDTIVVGGFGVGSPVAPQEYGRPLVRQLSIAQKKITAIAETSIVVSPDDESESSEIPLKHQSVAYSGDSGGAAYRCDERGFCEVVGINSWVDDLANIQLADDAADFKLIGSRKADLHLKKLAGDDALTKTVRFWIQKLAPDAVFGRE